MSRTGPISQPRTTERIIGWQKAILENEDRFRPIVIRAAITHLWFVTLHPFEDGNARVTRALTDRAMAQDEDSALSLVRMSSRILAVKGDSYNALGKAQNLATGIDITPWLEWFINQAEAACKQSETTIRNTLAKVKFWARHEGGGRSTSYDLPRDDLLG